MKMKALWKKNPRGRRGYSDIARRIFLEEYCPFHDRNRASLLFVILSILKYAQINYSSKHSYFYIYSNKVYFYISRLKYFFVILRSNWKMLRLVFEEIYSSFVVCCSFIYKYSVF